MSCIFYRFFELMGLFLAVEESAQRELKERLWNSSMHKAIFHINSFVQIHRENSPAGLFLANQMARKDSVKNCHTLPLFAFIQQKYDHKQAAFFDVLAQPRCLPR